MDLTASKRIDTNLAVIMLEVLSCDPELYLEILDEKCHNTHCLENQHDIPFPLISKFYLSGNHCVLTPGIKDVKDDYVEKINQNYLFYLPDIKEIEQWQAGEYIHLVRIATDIDFLRTFSTSFESLSPKLLQLIESDDVQHFHQSLGKITPTMQLALQKILNCPYQGMTKRMYLESKTLELLPITTTISSAASFACKGFIVTLTIFLAVRRLKIHLQATFPDRP